MTKPKTRKQYLKWLKGFEQNLIFKDIEFCRTKVGTPYVKFTVIPKDKRYKKRFFAFSNLYEEDLERFLRDCKTKAASLFYFPLLTGKGEIKLL